MELFDVYSLFDVTPERALGCRVWDRDGVEYLDLYGGHAVISVGHAHPLYVQAITEQLGRIGFYSNSVHNPLQEQLARAVGELSALEDWSLFLVNSGAEANENALKLASFSTGRDEVLAFRGSFHGRTSGAVAVTDNPGIVSPFNAVHKVSFAPLGDLEAVDELLSRGSFAAVIIEGIQGVGGINIPSPEFLRGLRDLCTKYGTVLILDEVQSGYGRTGNFFAYQRSSITPDLVTVAKGMANGFPIGGVLISPDFTPAKGMLGTTFGGNYLAMAAALAVAGIIRDEKLMDNAREVGGYLKESLLSLRESQFPDSPYQIADVRGEGLMLGVEFACPVAPLRRELLYSKHIFTGVSGKSMIRLLAPLCLSRQEAGQFISALSSLL